MKKIIIICIIFYIISNLFIVGCLDKDELQKNRIVIDGKGNYSSIQNAINNASKGDTIFVYEGNYYETLVINKSVKLIGASTEKPVLLYNKKINSRIISVNANNCIIEGFKIIYDINKSENKETVTGIRISSSRNKILNNTILNFKYGIEMTNCDNNLISYNTIENNTYGIQAYKVYYNDILNNNFSNNTRNGVYLGYESQHNLVSSNTFFNNDEAVLLSKNSASFNEISNNILIKNKQGINECCGAEGKNTIINNIYKD
jgi:parallel beta-helix repeat protein